MLSSTSVANGILTKSKAFSKSKLDGGAQGEIRAGAGDAYIEFDASDANSLYQNDLNEIRVNALFGLNLIKAF